MAMLQPQHHHLFLLRHRPPPPRLRLRLPTRPSSPHRLLPRARAVSAAASTAALEDFRRWLSSHGAGEGKALPAAVPEGLGLVAARDLPRGEVVAEVPKKLWMDFDAVAASDIGRACGGGGGLRPWVAVALLLLREVARGADSPWAPYLAILPRQTDSTIFWSEEELLEIQGTQLLSTTIGVKDYVQSEFESVEAEIINANKDLFPGTITFDDFLWAFGILRSRVFPELRGDKLALIPFADLVNHSPDITSEGSSWEIKGKGLFGREAMFSLRTPVDVKSGEQYDLDKSNAELALDYGFIESNPYRDSYTVTLGISESDPFYGDKLDIAELNGLGETAYFDVVLDEPLPPQMLTYLRLLCIGGTDAFILEALFRNSVWGHLELPLSPDNEESICQVMRDACKSALGAYHTTTQEDEELLETENLQSRLKIAIGVRAGEKKVLQQIDDIFKQREEELDGLEYYQERRLKDLGLVGDNGEIIFWET
ncbi:[Fructose-bisphosphate aldolase]-lysine N-methyltransferase, chloroplastic [Dichanthelium oligosanthes]|uniref:[Fructose-bisphosphate aldolase]-lysine N-methyltransferase, chloroplastic n=1 Tax=Dichanthelium oligosanthes TaxID=888268 RepID=A0A1E5UTV8_9POAL|nr:[Fructose-bisphosphate aldolase]-lysine N-methyltransferase, chloroplastic [Dichanthelium oligosanthes]